MDESSPVQLQDRVVSFIRGNLLISGMFVVGVICLGIGLIYLLQPSDNAIEFDPAEEVEGASTSQIYVDVSGEVQKPGVYKLDSNSRTQDALVKAGGFTADADREYVSKGMNLAAPLKDGMKIYIPKKGEAPVASSNQGTMGNGGMVSINSGSQSELESLPGIGPVTAGKIISSRPYSSIEELKSKKAVGSATYEKIKDLVGL